MDWRVINDFDQYRIYQDGRIYSCKNKIVLKASLRGSYKQVSLCKDNVKYTKTIHRLVAEHFIPNPENKPCVDHIDRNPLNNMYWNLRWVTYKENTKNTGVRNSNKLGEKYICFDKSSNKFKVEINTEHKIQKRFKTLDEAIEYRNAVCGMYDLVY